MITVKQRGGNFCKHMVVIENRMEMRMQVQAQIIAVGQSTLASLYDTF